MSDQPKLDLIKRNIERANKLRTKGGKPYGLRLMKDMDHGYMRSLEHQGYMYHSMLDGSVTQCINFDQWQRIAELDRAKYEATDSTKSK